MFSLDEKVLNYLKDSEQETFELLETLAQIPAPSGKEELRVKFIKKW